ncbi:MAG: hypothetical protein ACWGON_09410, partial [Gemmatimonadota bacterium]
LRDPADLAGKPARLFLGRIVDADSAYVNGRFVGTTSYRYPPRKYGIPAGRLRSYIDSYHGLKSKAGDVHVANCASCHGAHRILPHTDPTSSIYPDNLKETCGECHPGISTELASVPIHATSTGIKAGWPRFFTMVYVWLITLTIGTMLLHNSADWLRHVRNFRKKPFVIRMTFNEPRSTGCWRSPSSCW